MFGFGLLALIVGSALGGYSMRRTIARRLGRGPLVAQGIVRPRAAGSDIPHPRLPEVLARTLNVLLVVGGVVLLWSTLGANSLLVGAVVFAGDAVAYVVALRRASRDTGTGTGTGTDAYAVTGTGSGTSTGSSTSSGTSTGTSTGSEGGRSNGAAQ